MRKSNQVKSSQVQFFVTSQPRTGHTREPDPTRNELKHTTTRKTATHERTPQKNLSRSQGFTASHAQPMRRR